MHLILTGATGLVGSAVLQNMLTMESVTKISILSRRPVPMIAGHEDKAKVIIHKDFESYPPELLDQLKDAHGCVWAQGISAMKVSKPEYIKITIDYPLAAATAFSTLHPTTPFTFVYVSGEGATTAPGMLTSFFGKIKGQAETTLLALNASNPNFRPYSVRPGGVDPRAHTEILEFAAPYAAWQKPVWTGIKALYPSLHAPSRELGRVLTELAASKGEALGGKGVEGEGRIVNNVGWRRMAGL
ncbi:nucleoside-diphosphate-sugar epimerase [Mytilinidion resinicola]|uniref:Nucleoside-diphosphate-sugar epimerase n=1 Tax=Mytilinidion resinicola TaxID=574789 RepID=A0A6A6Y826_9PEZI|nr:nucleoside-diphosphate-sugar epimerase [Mytilinidion resinicola]KAF2804295.1 nucleoside-diphosphate-sugar epimerase [Mytilinidion resinicola]